MVEQKELDPEFVENVKEALSVWVEEHVSPDEPCLVPTDHSKLYSPRQMRDEIINSTEFGLELLDIYDGILSTDEERERDNMFRFFTGHPAPVQN